MPFLAALAALAATAATVSGWSAWCRRHGLTDDPGERKIHDRPVPLAGGLAVLTGLLLGLLALVAAAAAGVPGAPSLAAVWAGLGGDGLRWIGLGLGAAGLGAVGWVDDRRELRPGTKFLGQCLVALLVAACGVRVTWFGPHVAFSFAITVLWIVTVTNAFNFVDNMNGLCAGLGLVASVALALNAARADQPVVAALAMGLAGALGGFLPFNFPRATVFLGDSGSHLVGGLLAVLAVLLDIPAPRHTSSWGVGKPFLILAVPLADLAWVVLFRWWRGKPVSVGDTNHLSHQLVRRGWSQPGAVLVLGLAAALVGACSLLF